MTSPAPVWIAEPDPRFLTNRAELAGLGSFLDPDATFTTGDVGRWSFDIGIGALAGAALLGLIMMGTGQTEKGRVRRKRIRKAESELKAARSLPRW